MIKTMVATSLEAFLAMPQNGDKARLLKQIQRKESPRFYPLPIRERQIRKDYHSGFIPSSLKKHSE
jgi:hypothetical protein